MSLLDLDAIRRTRGVDLAVWPPRYDPAYRPPLDAQQWLPEVECASPEARDAVILAKLRGQVLVRDDPAGDHQHIRRVARPE